MTTPNSKHPTSTTPRTTRTLAMRGACWLADRLETRSIKSARAAFRHAAARVPAYADLLVTQGLNPAQITTTADFQNHVPITDKQSLFASYPIAQLCTDGRINNAANLYTSSGFSGTFSFGAENPGDEAKLKKRIDSLFNHHVDIHHQTTLLINCLSAGVHVPSAKTTVIDTSTRPHAVLGAVQQLGPAFDQILIIGEHAFIKHVIELGIDAGYDWRSQTTHIVTGGEWIPQGFRQYVGQILGHTESIQNNTNNADRPTLNDGILRVSVGVSELNLSLGQETSETRRIHELLCTDEKFRIALLGDSPFVPSLVHYHPLDAFVETPINDAGHPELVVTTLDRKRKLPLIRYKTGDRALAISHQKLRSVLDDFDLTHLCPRLPLPMLAMWGRAKGVEVQGEPTNDTTTQNNATEIYPEQIKECLYAPGVPTAQLTGQFHMRTEAGQLCIDFQLKAPPATPTQALPSQSQGSDSTPPPSNDEIAACLQQAIQNATGISCVVNTIDYSNYPHGMAVNYQSKFQYM